jgi:arsenite methyltransferase
VSDVVLRGDVPAEIRRSMELWFGCVAGALHEEDYASKLKAAGFVDVELEAWRVYQVDDARAFLAETGIDVNDFAPQVEGKVASAFSRARRPQAACCGPTCCA